MRNFARRVIIPIISISWHGGTRVLVQVANYLANLGYETEILVARKRCNTPFEFARGVKVKHVGIYTGLKWIDYPVYVLCVPFYLGGNAVAIANFFVSYYPIRLMSVINHLPFFYFVQDIESKYRAPAGALLNWLCNLTYRDRRIVAANSHLQSRLREEFGTTSRGVSVGPGSLFYSARTIAAKTYDVIYFLRAERWKGLDRFRRFLTLAQGKVSCLCVSQDESLRDEISGSSAVFRKPRGDGELIDCIDSAKILLLTSYDEGFALPPLEGMARGLPTVLYRCGGPDVYVVDGSNALYVSDESEAVSKIDGLLKDSMRYEAMSRAALKTAREYQMDKSLERLSDFVEECAKW